MLTAEELKRRREFYERTAELRAHQSGRTGPFTAVKVMVREDRDR
jgi:hypothetical protein